MNTAKIFSLGPHYVQQMKPWDSDFMYMLLIFDGDEKREGRCCFTGREGKAVLC
jgi:hypothetical protein